MRRRIKLAVDPNADIPQLELVTNASRRWIEQLSRDHLMLRRPLVRAKPYWAQRLRRAEICLIQVNLPLQSAR